MASLRDEPIIAESEDRLGRAGFVQRLVQALILPNGLSSGAVLGLTGEWGSGKSSILNLLEAAINNAHPEAIIVRFDPWLVSGRDDVIAAFFASLISSIKAKYGSVRVFNSARDQAIARTTEAIARYGGELSPLLNVAAPGLGLIGRAFTKRAEEAIKDRKDLRRQKQDMAEGLRSLGVPIIVLIDELDRVEDAEIRIMAQVVRAVADFREISYVLAYDQQRVIEALGATGSNTGSHLERGRSYLEKIVHLQIAVPVILEDELKNILSGILILVGNMNQADIGVSDQGRFNKLVDVLLNGTISSVRDVEKLKSAVQIRLFMVIGEVDWLSIVAFSALEMKAPNLTRVIRRRMDELVFDPQDYRHILSSKRKGVTSENIFQSMASSDEQTDGIRELFFYAFPAISGRSSGRDRLSEEIAYRRPLLTLLRLGVLPGAISRSEALGLLSLPESEMSRDLSERFRDGTLERVIDRMCEVTSDTRKFQTL